MYPDLIKGYRVTIGGYNAPLKEHRENTELVYVLRVLSLRLALQCHAFI